MDKVKKCRLDKRTVRWMEIWPNGQKQRVVVNNAKSSGRLITTGVFQGWILGPILFNIMTNDETECTFSKFSDATKLGGVPDTAHSFAAIQRSLGKLGKLLTGTS